MNKINRKVEYALIGLKHMRARQPGELTSVKEIATLYGVPFEATSKVMQVLASSGVIRSEQGAHGGYQLVRDLNRVSLFELMEIVVGRVEIAKCLHETENSCDLKNTCNVMSPISTLNRRLIDFYKSLMVGELLESRNNQARILEAHA
jgi:Rrf2 family transcriptional regulator, nitric oxide-sensitive transcriptional repressor